MFRTSPFLLEKLRCTQQTKAHKKSIEKSIVFNTLNRPIRKFLANIICGKKKEPVKDSSNILRCLK